MSHKNKVFAMPIRRAKCVHWAASGDPVMHGSTALTEQIACAWKSRKRPACSFASAEWV
jgi:hypothetical protein